MHRFRVETVGTQGFNLYVQDVFSCRELEARRNHMLAMGWTPPEIVREMMGLQDPRNLCEEPYPLDISVDYIWSSVGPGDLVEICDFRSIVNPWGFA